MENQEEDTVLINNDQNITSKLQRQAIRGDGACLFSALNYIINDGNFDVNNAQANNQQLRNAIALSIEGNADLFSETLLGTPPHDYAERVQNPETWGGDIEIRVFEMMHEIEIRIVDLTRGRVIQQGPPYALHCAYVTWDNRHYEPLYRFDPTTQQVQTRFLPNDELSDEDMETIDQWVQEVRPNNN
jgi:ubiquitin thioesterase OTU1